MGRRELFEADCRCMLRFDLSTVSPAYLRLRFTYFGSIPIRMCESLPPVLYGRSYGYYTSSTSGREVDRDLSSVRVAMRIKYPNVTCLKMYHLLLEDS